MEFDDLYTWCEKYDFLGNVLKAEDLEADGIQRISFKRGDINLWEVIPRKWEWADHHFLNDSFRIFYASVFNSNPGRIFPLAFGDEAPSVGVQLRELAGTCLGISHVVELRQLEHPKGFRRYPQIIIHEFSQWHYTTLRYMKFPYDFKLQKS